MMEVERLQLPIFSDDNPKAYSAVTYLRYKTSKDKFKTMFVIAKSVFEPLRNRLFHDSNWWGHLLVLGFQIISQTL